jgi:hypothetical protein
MKKIIKKIFKIGSNKKMSKENNIMDYLILNGGIEVSGIDSDTGEILYNFTPKLKYLMPDLYDAHIKNVNKEIMNLWQKGFVDIDLMEDDPIVTLAEKAFSEPDIKELSVEEKWSLNETKRMLRNKEL